MGARWTIDCYNVLLQRREDVYTGNSAWEAFTAYWNRKRLGNCRYFIVRYAP